MNTDILLILCLVLVVIQFVLGKAIEKLQDELISEQEEEIKRQVDLIEAQRKLIETLKGVDNGEN